MPADSGGSAVVRRAQGRMASGRARKLAVRTGLYRPLTRLRERLRFLAWRLGGGASPPPHLVKQRVVVEYGRRFGLRTLIETGTYTGLMVDACRNRFSRIFSIELDHTLHERAVALFEGLAHVSVLEGDSAEVLRDVLDDVSESCLFWLDAHYSGGITARGPVETPVERELLAILRHPVDGHVVLIDDARDFGRRDDYPTLAELRALVRQHRVDWVMEVADDIIRIHPPAP